MNATDFKTHFTETAHLLLTQSERRLGSFFGNSHLAPLMEWRVNLSWKLTADDEASLFRDRSQRMDQIADKYKDFMTDGGSGFGFGQRDMDWTFNSDAIAHECMQAIMVELCRELNLGTLAFDATLDALDDRDIQVYITEYNPEDYD